MIRDTGQERVTDVIQGGPSLPLSNRLRNVAAPDSTSKELTSINNHSGKQNRVNAAVSEGAYRVAEPELPMTNKAINTDFEHAGLPRGVTSQVPLEPEAELKVTMRSLNAERVPEVGLPRSSWIQPPSERAEIDVPAPLRAYAATPAVGNPVGRTIHAPDTSEGRYERLGGEPVASGRVGIVRSVRTAQPEPGAHEDRGSAAPNSALRDRAPRASVPAHMSYDSAFEYQGGQPTLEGATFGAPSSRTQAVAVAGEQTRGERTDLSREHFGGPAGKRVDAHGADIADQIIDLGGKEVTTGRLGNPYTGSASVNRRAEVRVADKPTPEGRLQAPRVTDRFVENCTPSYRLRRENEDPVRPGLSRVNERSSREPAIQVRSRNVEAVNTRLDPELRNPQVVSDLRPCLSTPSSRASSPVP
jgi:hypothetical protein